MSNKTYDALKVVSLIIPLLASLYFGLAKIWGLPYGTEITGTLSLIETFLIGMLKVLSDTYHKEQRLLAENTDCKGDDVIE